MRNKSLSKTEKTWLASSGVIAVIIKLASDGDATAALASWFT